MFDDKRDSRVSRGKTTYAWGRQGGGPPSREAAPGGPPFEKVTDETGMIFLQCTYCSRSVKVWDGQAAQGILYSRLGKVRLFCQMPAMFKGLLRFFIEHVDCGSRR